MIEKNEKRKRKKENLQILQIPVGASETGSPAHHTTDSASAVLMISSQA